MTKLCWFTIDLKNAATQIVMTENFLPLEEKSSNNNINMDYLFEPSQEEIVKDLIPKIIKDTAV